jgi:hypothetical protein
MMRRLGRREENGLFQVLGREILVGSKLMTAFAAFQA